MVVPDTAVDSSQEGVVFTGFARMKQFVVFGGLALTVLAADSAPLAGLDHAEAAKGKK
jgi:hypothetical protein